MASNELPNSLPTTQAPRNSLEASSSSLQSRNPYRRQGSHQIYNDSEDTSPGQIVDLGETPRDYRTSPVTGLGITEADAGNRQSSADGHEQPTPPLPTWSTHHSNPTSGRIRRKPISCSNSDGTSQRYHNSPPSFSSPDSPYTPPSAAEPLRPLSTAGKGTCVDSINIDCPTDGAILDAR